MEFQVQQKEMEKRLNQRLSLFEQAQVASAKARAQAEVQSILQKAGLVVVGDK